MKNFAVIIENGASTTEMTSGWGVSLVRSNPNIRFADEFPTKLRWVPEDEDELIRDIRDDKQVEYLQGSLLGCGGFGRVYKMLRKSDGHLLAGKSTRSVEDMWEEAKKLQQFDHNHIVKYEGWCTAVDERQTQTAFLLTELCAGGELATHLDNTPRMRSVDAARALQQVSSALAYLHGRGLFHTDVKPRNMFVRSFARLEVVLGDCGDVQPAAGYAGPMLGTPAFWSPQVLRRRHNTGPADDVWALGVSGLGMVGQWPRVQYVPQGRGSDKYVRDINGYPRLCFEHVQALLALNPDNGLVRLLARMLEWDAADRATAEECVALAEALLQAARDGGDDNVDGDGKIVSPEGFEAVEFW